MNDYPSEASVWTWLEQVRDPEVPVLSVRDLGIIRSVTSDADGSVTITITPTYSGCPAMDVIGQNIKMALAGRGFKEVRVALQLSPAWTTDWMSESGKQKLLEYGIAPPQRLARTLALFEEEPNVPCPRCQSDNTRLVSQHGATACKALYQCNTCHEPFEHFKCH
ncbi:MAG: phenylacetate-CoA oxygenase subunit PaaJ [Bacteroidetes bacterium]|nr:phenylacetate-CoA oxygenase subunit PaaJ [Bacteroidota bacterium]